MSKYIRIFEVIQQEKSPVWPNQVANLFGKAGERLLGPKASSYDLRMRSSNALRCCLASLTGLVGFTGTFL